MRTGFLKCLIVTVTALVTVGCPNRKGAEAASPAFPKDFPMVSVPSMLNDQEAYFKYVSLHFWDAFIDSASVWCAYDDSTRCGGVSKENLQKSYCEYAQLLWNIPVKDAISSQCRLMDRLEGLAMKETSAVPVFKLMCELADDCLYGVNSDFRNEEFYIPVLDKLVHTTLRSSITEDALKEKYRKELADCSKNRIGEIAADFSYSTSSGQSGTLHKVKGDLILIFFSNPGCSACLEIINSLKGSEPVSRLISSAKLTVLNIYIDEDLTEWFKYMPVYPKEWVNAYQPDLQVREKGIYDVRAIPSLYILDKDKRVLFKDVTPNVALAYLEHIAGTE